MNLNWHRGNSLMGYWVIIIFILTALLPLRLVAQSVPVGTPVLEEAYRRAQLLGQADSNVSFMVRPIFPVSCFKQKSVFDPYRENPVRQGHSTDGALSFGKGNGVVQLLPISWQQQYNTHHPYSLNDGALIPARGYQTMVSGGVFAKYGPLSIQLRPEYVYAKNNDFQGFYKEQSDAVWAGYYSVYNYIDLPEKFGNDPYQQLSWGQSSIRFTVGPLSLGLSNENIWWGPGIRNSFIQTNTAPGFKHITLNTARPIKTFLGAFEGQLICGRLEDSGFAPPDTNRTFYGTKLYSRKRTDWRYVNAVVVSYHPKWVPGLFLGAARNFMSYYKDIGNKITDYLPVITPVTKKANYGEGENTYPNDQRASVFVRWVWQKEQAEIYWEFGREDHSFDLRDFLVQPDHDHGYLFGIRKLFTLNKQKDRYIKVNAELTQLSLTGTNPERPEGEIYLHTQLRQGYTNQGQLLGAGIGPGSNMQVVGVHWVQSLKSIGIQVERYVHDNNFQINSIVDTRANWVDFSTAAIAAWDYGHFLFSFKFEVIRSYNYQYLYRPIPRTPSFYWDPGRDIYNYQGNLGVSYRF